MTDFPYPVPIVRLIVCDAKGRILLLKRFNTAHGLGHWCLPGGKVDYGETIEEAGRKELLEETGLTCTSMRFLFYQDSLPPTEGEMHGINFYFECRATGEVALNPESSEYHWVGPDTINDYQIAFNNDEALILYWQHTADAGRQE